MNIGGISMAAPAQAAMGALQGALDVQSGAVAKLMGGAEQGQMMQAAMAEQGKGQRLDLTV